MLQSDKIPNKIKDFSLYKNKDNTITSGYLYTNTINIPFAEVENERTVRVWLPEAYFTGSKRYPVLYMYDGQNIVDEKTSGFGEWNIDDHVTNLISSGDIDGLIVVGLDCPHTGNGVYRTKEYNPYSKEYRSGDKMIRKGGKGYGELTANFMVNDVKPLVESTFRVKKGRENSGIGGSSMGGLMAFYTGLNYPEEIGFSLCFSPAFLRGDGDKIINKVLKKSLMNPSAYGKFAFFVGGIEFEAEFIEGTNHIYDYLKSNGFTDKQIHITHDPLMRHHEYSWSLYFEDAIKFLLPKKED